MKRAERIKNIALSPGVSFILAALGALCMLFTSATPLLTIVFSLLAALALIYVAKGRALFRGSFYPIAALYLWLQAAFDAGAADSLLSLVAVGSMTLLLLCFSRPENTRLLFIVYLVCGLGALVSRGYAMLAAVLFVPMVLLHIFSMRGLVASLLGFITPAIILCGFAIYNPADLPPLYAKGWLFGFDPFVVATVAVGALSVLLTFFKAYGYPAKMRAGNMAVIGLTLASCVLPFADLAHAAEYIPLINIGSAYNLTHFASTSKFGWILVALLCVAGAASVFTHLL